MELDKLKKEYDVFVKKYNLPNFKNLNNDFEIDRIDKEKDYLLRTIRKLMMEKIVNSLNFLEMLINPNSLPRMYFSFISKMNVEDRNLINKIYGFFADLVLFSLELEVDSSEKGESKLIREIFDVWNSNKNDFKKLINKIKNPNKIIEKKIRSYFD